MMPTTSTVTGPKARFAIIHFILDNTWGSRPRPAGSIMLTRANCLLKEKATGKSYKKQLKHKHNISKSFRRKVSSKIYKKAT